MNNTEIQELLGKAGWSLPSKLWSCLSEYEAGFMESEFGVRETSGGIIRNLDYYRHRVENLGFTDLDTVIDAGCGMGQWSIALSERNKFVKGVDINVGRLLIAQALSDAMAVPNLEFQYSPLENLPFSDQSADGIFCYGVFMFTHMPTTMKEFSRLLKSGGYLYLNANSIGWYAHLLFDRGFKERNFGMLQTSIRMLLRSALGKKQNVVVRPRWLQTILENHGFSLISMGAEGSIQVNSQSSKPAPAYPRVFYGLPAITEVLAVKN